MVPYKVPWSPLVTSHTLLIHGALHLQMLWVLTTTFGAVGGQVLDAVEQGDTLKERHPLPICVFGDPLDDHFQGSGVGIGGALGCLVGASTHGAPAVLPLPRALGNNMPHLCDD